MKLLDKGVIYVPIDKHTTKEEMNEIRSKNHTKTVVFLRSGTEDMQKILLNFIVPR
jgi:hypothetical protein